eukprot:3157031-Rhodomonas_salina.4
MAAIRIRFGCLRRDVRHCIRYAAPVVLRVLPFCHTICSLAKYGGEIGCVDTSLSMRGSETGCVGTNRLEDEDHDASGQMECEVAKRVIVGLMPSMEWEATQRAAGLIVDHVLNTCNTVDMRHAIYMSHPQLHPHVSSFHLQPRILRVRRITGTEIGGAVGRARRQMEQ